MKFNNLSLSLLPLILYGCASNTHLGTSSSQQLQHVQDRYRQATIDLLDTSKFNYSGQINQQIIQKTKDESNAKAISDNQRKKLENFLKHQGVLWNVGQIHQFLNEVNENTSSGYDNYTRRISTDEINFLQFLNQANVEFNGSINWQDKLSHFNLSAKYQNHLLQAQTRIPVVFDLKDYRIYTQLAGVVPHYLSAEDQERYFYADFSQAKSRFERVNWKLLKQYLQEQMSLIYLLGEAENYQIIQNPKIAQNTDINQKLSMQFTPEELELQRLLFNVVNYHHIYRNILGYQKFKSDEINTLDSYDLKYALTIPSEVIENYIEEYEVAEKYRNLPDDEKEAFLEQYIAEQNSDEASEEEVSEESDDAEDHRISVQKELKDNNLNYAVRAQLYRIYNERQNELYYDSNQYEDEYEAAQAYSSSDDEAYEEEEEYYSYDATIISAADAAATDAAAAATDAAAAATDAAATDASSFEDTEHYHSEQETLDIQTCIELLKSHDPKQLNNAISCEMQHNLSAYHTDDINQYLDHQKLQPLMELFNQYNQDQFTNAKAFQVLWFKHQAEIKAYLASKPTNNDQTKVIIESGLNGKGQLNYQTLKTTLPLQKDKVDLAVQIDMHIQPYQAPNFDRKNLKDAKPLNSLDFSHPYTRFITNFEEEYSTSVEEISENDSSNEQDEYFDDREFIKQSIHQSYGKHKDPIKAYKTGILLYYALQVPQLLEKYSSDDLDQFAELSAYQYFKSSDTPINEKKYQQLIAKFGKTEVFDEYDRIGSLVTSEIDDFSEKQEKNNLIKKYDSPESKFSALYTYLFKQNYKTLVAYADESDHIPDFSKLPKYSNILGKIYSISRQGKPLDKDMLNDFESLAELELYLDLDLYGEAYEFLETK